ncbi:protein translocase subunit SecD [Patescibacteria group bacterium]|nr:protein translocase subunit SecD [Patescibacteria group bacterium]MCG2702411.1 protein translocase subunit SecD [Candidatus Parcubacteria bacterium]MBU4264539.1 protein translocase subunit SecD [Patescibacteria group bacterium]MBU4390470.1 protein translocase subunit SecD [Patescibacteria group bacterium]MBU4397386.1 protein translocase subunit SecD [Patescibacteria group bacterium]
MNNKRTKKIFWAILALGLLGLVINMPQNIPIKIHWWKINQEYDLKKPKIDFSWGNFNFKKDLDLKYGLDLAGGVRLLFEIDSSEINQEDKDKATVSLKENIERRVNIFGLSEANVQILKEEESDRLIVELPGIEDIDQAASLMGQTAKLEFFGEVEIPPEATESATVYDLFSKETGLTGSNLTKSDVVINNNTGKAEVALEFDETGAKLFEKATQDMIGKRIAIFLDSGLVTFPTVNDVIKDGKAIISGNFDLKEAKSLSAQLNAGALPMPIKLISQDKIGATLGKDSIKKGLRAGMVGLIILAMFMIGNYGRLGLIANIGLLVYGLITLSLYRLIPITLTFPGIVGFILSIGMAVDSNILIFERMKEELRKGRPWSVAMELGFGKAWDSIKDANVCTLITGLILFNPLNWKFLNSSGMVRGFAVTLLLGIGISLFTGIVVTRNLLRMFAKEKQS